MIARITSSTIRGVEAEPVEVQVETRPGKNRFTIIGLGDSAVKEARDRVTAALQASGFNLPRAVLINLAPADLKKEGTTFDLAMAIGILAASGQVPLRNLRGVSLYGELSLDGALKPVRGMIALLIGGEQESRAHEVIVPQSNGAEATLLRSVRVREARSLLEVVAHLRGVRELGVSVPPELCATTAEGGIEEVYGQERAKRALIIAAAGGHNLLMIGPPGCGKSMLAARLPHVLPPLNERERLEAVKIHSISGQPLAPVLLGRRPFRAPHHTISDVGLIGGGAEPRPGEISLAHHGVLFLDEFPEFRRGALEALRAPLEMGEVVVSRARSRVTLPARLQLIAAMNPCPCGRLGTEAQGRSACVCSVRQIQEYLKRLSGPILDRIDLNVELDPVPIEKLAQAMTTQSPGPAHLTNSTRAQVMACRARQEERQGSPNASLAGARGREALSLSAGAMKIMTRAAERLQLSGRGFVRTLKVARTIADLAGEDRISDHALAEALQFRGLERLRRYAQL